MGIELITQVQQKHSSHLCYCTSTEYICSVNYEEFVNLMFGSSDQISGGLKLLTLKVELKDQTIKKKVETNEPI